MSLLLVLVEKSPSLSHQVSQHTENVDEENVDEDFVEEMEVDEVENDENDEEAILLAEREQRASPLYRSILILSI